VTNPLRRFLVVSAFSIGLVVYWFMTIGSSSDFPTGEVQYAVMPALLHPYQQAWQAPYGVIWYGIQYAIMYAVYPFVNLFRDSLTCPNNCNAIVYYLNGTTKTLPFDGGQTQWIMSLSWMIGLTIFNLPFFYLLRKSSLLIPYFMSSMWLWMTVPVNLSILWIVLLAYLKLPVKGHNIAWIFLPLSILAKLPVGAPGYVWSFGLGSASTLGHWFPYLMVGFWIIGLSVHWIDRWWHLGNPIWFPWLGLYSRVIQEYE
jgi:hypothetical protein